MSLAYDAPSPCAGRCRLDPDSGLCTGCLRTRAEISRWAGMPNSDRQLVLELIRFRRIPQS